ncbi:acyl CoA:acetate/3-ketoacid CoA transferase [Acidovorax sp. MR-S7]|nr:acyl CoA:acetate/3-ketoacid CoA transferase [Acidovorax sp. MR-S7]
MGPGIAPAAGDKDTAGIEVDAVRPDSMVTGGKATASLHGLICESTVILRRSWLALRTVCVNLAAMC